MRAGRAIPDIARHAPVLGTMRSSTISRSRRSLDYHADTAIRHIKESRGLTDQGLLSQLFFCYCLYFQSAI